MGGKDRVHLCPVGFWELNVLLLRCRLLYFGNVSSADGDGYALCSSGAIALLSSV